MKQFILLIALSTIFFKVSAQVGINNDGTPPDPSAILDIKSSSQGALLPRMTQDQILAIQNPANGLTVFCTTDNKLYIYLANSGKWKEVPFGTGSLGEPFPCGISVTLNHIAGLVAPVNKTITYGTVANIPGEPSKCWITQNLGASQQAAAVTDVTEVSAGWYWQFNRKQGYQVGGSGTIPAWVNMDATGINEISDWLIGNDPCRIELGAEWRVPTFSEWINVDNAGGWGNWNDSWNSGLKLHGAGYIYMAYGIVYLRGAEGRFWSTTEYTYSSGYYLGTNSSTCGLTQYYKSNGLNLRCLR